MRNRQALEMFLAPLSILPFDEHAAWAYGELRADLERRGTPIGSLGTMIAAHPLSLQVEVGADGLGALSHQIVHACS